MRTFTRAILLLASAIALYVATACWVLHFGMDRVLFPRVPGFEGPASTAIASFRGKSGNELLVRRYGEAKLGCVLFFPGQHGTTASYDFPGYAAAGLAAFVIAYPGQDGAAGRAGLDEIERLVDAARTAVLDECQPARTVFVGVSLGSMLAAYASHSVQPAGLVLVSTAPSLSTAIRVRLRANPLSLPLGWLPLSKLLARDYSLRQGLDSASGKRAVIFQGTQDEQTPLELLRSSGIFSGEVNLVPVPGGTHSTTFALSRESQLAAVLAFIRGEAVCEPATLALKCAD